MASDLVLYQPATNTFEVRFRNKLVLFADENQPQIVHVALDDISCKKGNIKHLFSHSFSVADIRNVGYEKLDQDGVEITFKVTKYCTTKIKKSMFNSCIARKPMKYESDDKENVNTENLERIEFDIDTDNESIGVKRYTLVSDENYNESEVEEGPRFSKSKARNRSSSLIHKKTPRNSSSNLKVKTRRPTPVGMDSILDRRLSSVNQLINIPSSQKSNKTFRSSFSIHTGNSIKIRSDLSGCNIPRPNRNSFRSTDTKSQLIDSAGLDKYTLLK
jgi:hypothetical protein